MGGNSHHDSGNYSPEVRARLAEIFDLSLSAEEAVFKKRLAEISLEDKEALLPHIAGRVEALMDEILGDELAGARESGVASLNVYKVSSEHPFKMARLDDPEFDYFLLFAVQGNKLYETYYGKERPVSVEKQIDDEALLTRILGTPDQGGEWTELDPEGAIEAVKDLLPFWQKQSTEGTSYTE
jgi:hypothetical protein